MDLVCSGTAEAAEAGFWPLSEGRVGSEVDVRQIDVWYILSRCTMIYSHDVDYRALYGGSIFGSRQTRLGPC